MTEDYAIIGRKKYVPIEQVGCEGCSFVKGDHICRQLKCVPRFRKDKRDVIWVEDTSTNFQNRTIRLLKL